MLPTDFASAQMALHGCKNFDLLKRWWLVVHRGDSNPTVVKVKAHSEISTENFHLEILQLGNRAADHAAKTAAKQLSKAYTSHLQAEAAASKDYKEKLADEY